MLIQDSNLVPAQILSGLKAKYLAESANELPVQLEIDVTPTGAYYLNLYIETIDEFEYCLLVEVSLERLQLVALGELQLSIPYLFPESGFCYAALFDQSGEISKLALVEPNEIKLKKLILENHIVTFDLESKKPDVDLLKKAFIRRRIQIDLKVEAKSLKSNVRYWSIKNFLIPFTELIKTALIDHHPTYTAQTIEKSVDLGFNCLEIGSLHAILEFNFRPLLFYNHTEYDNIVNLYYLLHEDDEEKIIEFLGRFTNKKLIPDYIKVLRAIISNNATMSTTIVTPHEVLNQAYFDNQRSLNLKRFLESRLIVPPYDISVYGTLTKLDFNKKGVPGFALQSTLDDQNYCGAIDQSVRDRITSNDFNFLNKEYQCLLNVTYTPESPLNKEKYDYILMDIKSEEDVEIEID
jgi:hypothetical protein